jgi:hypothetical protein
MPKNNERASVRSRERTSRSFLNLGLLIAGLLLIVPANAGAGVSVRAESGDSSALLSASNITPTSAQVSGDGGAFSCSGADTAAGALNAATGGDWAGKKFTGIGDFQVGRITSVDFTTEPTADYYWSFNVNDEAASAGICGTTVHDGDRILFYKACNMALSGCYSGTVLSLSGPSAAAPGVPTTFTVEQVSTSYGPAPDYTPSTSRTPANGVTVQAGSSSVVTGLDGKATLALGAGPFSVRATRSNDVPGQSNICVTTGSDGACTPLIPAAKPAKSAPKITSVKNGKRSSRKHAPRELKGAVVAGKSGIKEVRLRLARTVGDNCSWFDDDDLKFGAARRCGVKYAKFFVVGTDSDFSFLLPKRLGKGNYVLDVQVVDKNGSKTKSFVNGANRVKFKVN